MDQNESPKIDLHLCDQYIFDKDAKVIQWGNEVWTNGVEQLDIHTEKTDLNLNININLKWITDANVKAKTIKLTENF